MSDSILPTYTHPSDQVEELLMPLSNYALDHLVAARLSELTECKAIDMTGHDDQSEHWVGNFALTAMLLLYVQDPYHAVGVLFLRRADLAFAELENGR